MKHHEKDIQTLTEELKKLEELCQSQRESLTTHGQSVARLEIARQRQQAHLEDAWKEVDELKLKLKENQNTQVPAKKESEEMIILLKKELNDKEEEYEVGWVSLSLMNTFKSCRSLAVTYCSYASIT